MKRIILTFSMTIVFLCLLCAAVGATEFGEVETIDGMSVKSKLDTTSRVVLFDGENYHTYPAYYVFANDTTAKLSFDQINTNVNADLAEGEEGITYSVDSVVMVEVPEGALTVGGMNGADLLEYVKIPSTATNLRGTAFKGSTALKTVEFSNAGNLTTLGDEVFSGCSSLTTGSLPEGVTTVGTNTFNSCVSITSFTLPSTLSTIGTNMYLGCTGITGDLVIPSTVTAINAKAFSGSGITSVVVPATVTTLGTYVFQNCDSLVRAEVYGTKISQYMFNSCDKLTTAIIPNVTVIDGRGFSQSKKLANIVFPECLTTINSCAFYDCDGLTSIVVPSSVTTVQDKVFESTNIATAVIKSTVVGERMFYGAPLADLTLENTVTIGKAAFYQCDFVEIVLPETVTSIGQSAFQYCTAMTTITIPNTVETFGATPFDSCSKLVTVNYTGKDATVLTSLVPSKATVVLQNHCEVYREGAHEFGDDESIEVTSFYEDININNVCLGCLETKVVRTIGKLFTCLGYSACEEYNGITISYIANVDAIDQYNLETGREISYGVFAVSRNNIGKDEIFDENGEKANGVIFADITSYRFVKFDLKITNFQDSQKTLDLVMGAFVLDNGEYTYLQEGTPNEDEKYCFTSYSSIVGEVV